ncbi:MAG: hypothetical protein AAF581_10375 [Planctomycetota bacterium]
MESSLAQLIADFQRRAAQAVALLQSAGVDLPESNLAWASDARPPAELPGGFRCRKHGFGCVVSGPDWCVDFDFGEEGQFDGFDAWRLFWFAQRANGHYDFETLADMRTAVEAATTEGALTRKGQMWYLVPSAG